MARPLPEDSTSATPASLVVQRIGAFPRFFVPATAAFNVNASPTEISRSPVSMTKLGVDASLGFHTLFSAFTFRETIRTLPPSV
ncbi:hypothetical protein D1872_282770 [compost metagenome]